MHIRLATTRDLHRLAAITVSSLPDGRAFDYMWSYRHQYPEDNFFFWQLKLQEWLYDKKCTFIVMVLDNNDEVPLANSEVVRDTIISYAIWRRDGSSKEARAIWAKKNTLLNIIDSWTTWVESWSISKKYVRRDGDVSRFQAFIAALQGIEEKYYANHQEKWILELLATDVQYRRRGAATALIQWGTDRADQEGICCRVEASPMGKPVYASCGFEELGSWDVQVKGQPEILQLHCMFRKAPTQRGEGVKPISLLI